MSNLDRNSDSLDRETIKEQLREELRNELKEELKKELLGEEDEQERSEQDYPWILFALGGTEYAINSKYVLSIEILGEITPVVDSQPHCPGITRSRGDMIELLDMRALFGLGDYRTAKDSDGDDDRYMLVVIETDGIKRGVIVDQIVSVEYITNFVDNVISDEVGAMQSQYIRQVARREKTDSPVLIIKPESLNT